MRLRILHPTILGAGALLLSPVLATAQFDTVYVPPLTQYTDGGGNTARDVFGDNPFRSQHIVKGDFLVDPNVSPILLLTSISFRPDSGTQSIGAPTGGTFTDVVVKLSYTNYDPISISTLFDTNVAGQPQFTVYDCTANGTDPDIVIPPHPTTNDQQPAPWFDIIFSGPNNPFIFQPGVVDPVFNPMGYDHLLIDIVSTVAPGTGFIAIDAHQPGGKHREVGTSGTVGCPDMFAPYRLQVSGSSIAGNAGGNRAGMVPGDSFTVFASGAPCYATPVGPADALTTLFLQFDVPPYPTVPTPIDLGFFGMPGQRLLIQPTPGVEWPNVFTSGFRGPTATWTFDLGVGGVIDPGMENWRVLAQCATVDPALAAPLTVAWSNAVEMFFGLTGGMAAHPTGQCSRDDPARPDGRVTGDFTSARSYGAVIKIN